MNDSVVLNGSLCVVAEHDNAALVRTPAGVFCTRAPSALVRSRMFHYIAVYSGRLVAATIVALVIVSILHFTGLVMLAAGAYEQALTAGAGLTVASILVSSWSSMILERGVRILTPEEVGEESIAALRVLAPSILHMWAREPTLVSMSMQEIRGVLLDRE